MAVIRWRPLQEIDKFLDDLQLIQNFGIKDLAADVYEENGNIIVEINVAGLDPKNIDISVEGDHLKISGSRKQEEEKEGRNYYKKEIRRGDFERIIHLPGEVNQNQARAETKEGILKVILPKKEKEKGQKIKVEKAK